MQRISIIVYINALAMLFCLGIPSSLAANKIDPSAVKIAFIADIHLHDIYAKVENNQASQLFPKDGTSGSPLLMRSMSAQLGSTRLFNENYFVFKAALDDLVKRNIKLVALPGDFTDDGQPINVQAVAALLDEYQQKHAMQFFTITGNHDPVKPFTVAGGKSNFLQQNGQELGIYSPNHKNCIDDKNTSVICSQTMQYWGYKEIMATLAQHGFSPQRHYLYYETPFSVSKGKDWNIQNSLNENHFEQRQLTWCTDDDKTQCINMPDASYLVEPIEGLWLLAIDANVYEPVKSEDGTVTTFKGSSGAGYNAMRTFKQPVLDWVTDVVNRAKQLNKQLVAFSHFPMTDFYDGAAIDIQALFGNKAFQMKRMPSAETENALANTGLQLHFAGHMHINDTGMAKSDSGSVLFNIQVPSLAAYQPGYKLLTLSKQGMAHIETVVLNPIPNFNLLFTHYLTEWHYRDSQNLANWDKSILNAKSYLELTDKHLQGVVTQRYLPREWPKTLVDFMRNHDSHKIVALAQCAKETSDSTQFGEITQQPAIEGLSMIFDLYRIRNADHIASVPESRKSLYVLLHKLFNTQKACWKGNATTGQQLAELFSLMFKQLDSEASNNFTIDLKRNKLTSN